MTGLILAGGRSTRFGSNKALYSLEGATMLEHVFGAVAAVADPVLVSIQDEPFPLPMSARTVRDEWPGAGPLAGLQAGLRQSPSEWLLVVACDMPFVTGAALQALMAAASGQAQAVVATDGTDDQPLCACYHRSILPIVEEQLAAGRRSMFGLLDRLAHIVRVPLDPGLLRNINRPEDL